MRHQEDIIDAVCEDTGFSREIVEFVIEDFWDNVHFWLTNPLAAGTKVEVESFIKFFVHPYHLGLRIENSNKLRENEDYIKARVYYLVQVAKQICNNGFKKRQAQHGINDARYGKHHWKKPEGEKVEPVYPRFTHLYWDEREYYK